MDLIRVISILNVTIKVQHLQLSRRKINLVERSKYLVDTQIFNGHHLVNINLAMEIHFCFHYVKMEILFCLKVKVIKRKFLIKMKCYVALEEVILGYIKIAITIFFLILQQAIIMKHFKKFRMEFLLMKNILQDLFILRYQKLKYLF